ALSVPPGLALAVEGVDVLQPDPEGPFHGMADVDLGGRRVDHEDVDVVVHQAVRLLRHHGSEEHVVGIPHDALPSASVSVLSVSAPAAAVTGASTGSAATGASAA